MKNNKQRMIIQWRKRKNLCELCGRFLADEEHECLENYVKADMRYEDLPKHEIVVELSKSPVSFEEEVNVTDKVEIQEVDPDKQKDIRDRRKETIITYRKKKNLCIVCGKAFNNDRLEGGDCHNYDCEPNYEKSDMRTDEEKEKDPRIVETPREKTTTIQEEIARDRINKTFIQSSPNPLMHLEPTDNVKVLKLRQFIMIDLRPSNNGQLITFEYLEFMHRKFKKYFIYTIGDASQVYTALEIMNLKKFANVYSLDNMMDQNIVDHLHACIRFFGFPSEYLTYCMTRGIKCTTFVKNTNMDIPCTMISVDDTENVDLSIVSRNTAACRL